MVILIEIVVPVASLLTFPKPLLGDSAAYSAEYPAENLEAQLFHQLQFQ